MDASVKKHVLPPSVYPLSHSQETIDVLQKRLQAAEDDTKLLVDALMSMGVEKMARDVIPTKLGQAEDKTTSSVSPYKPRIADPEVLQKNYESIISRVCKTESTIQTLKLNLLQAHTELDLRKKDKIQIRDKLSLAADAYEKEIKRINNDLVISRNECKKTEEEKRRLKEEIKKQQESLDAATTSKAELSLEVENLNASKQKLQRRANELKEELSREAALRASLEEAHTSLLTRIHDMEGVVESERTEVQSLGLSCNSLKRNLVAAQEEAKRERQTRQELEDKLVKLQTKKKKVPTATLR